MQRQRDDKDAGHDQRGDGQSEAKIDGQIVGRRLASGWRDTGAMSPAGVQEL
ncbi:hypothetical protein X760_24815 [Mesorhizobium sp. LSHC422A00]|nr:hypothetical protein X770_10760 [Mesorhizobium sp. LSJC269B00]ESX08170.1 hypothetical protein X768_24175 [Mesorhizobium sp. LSJC265A00]ESX55862.1 hypothetical protein X760_24815 [Mesorhizobium sp. LSHC422A00]ESY16115.1 hypothetical protein X750_27000 [Mesorhizobium sp. LNJC394B00]